MQAIGSAWASLATQLVTASWHKTILAVMILRLTVNYLILARLFAFAAFVFLAGMLSKEFDTWYIGYFIMIACSMVFAFVIKLINLKALVDIIRNE